VSRRRLSTIRSNHISTIQHTSDHTQHSVTMINVNFTFVYSRDEQRRVGRSKRAAMFRQDQAITNRSENLTVTFSGYRGSSQVISQY
jgi:hypothetical protein